MPQGWQRLLKAGDNTEYVIDDAHNIREKLRGAFIGIKLARSDRALYYIPELHDSVIWRIDLLTNERRQMGKIKRARCVQSNGEWSVEVDFASTDNINMIRCLNDAGQVTILGSKPLLNAPTRGAFVWQAVVSETHSLLVERAAERSSAVDFS